jgi:hypothetical protein
MERRIREVSEVHINRDSDLADLRIRDSEGREATVPTTEHHTFCCAWTARLSGDIESIKDHVRLETLALKLPGWQLR